MLTPEQQTLVFDSPIHTIAGEKTTLGAYRGKALLVVNVASECGLTPQYEQLQAVYQTYADRGFSVIAFPCNQFGQQEPGTSDEILAFGQEKFHVTFPLMEKVDTNGTGRHAIYKALTSVKDAKQEAGDVQWNFEKFVVSSDGTHVTRFRPRTLPDAPEVLKAIEASLPQ